MDREPTFVRLSLSEVPERDRAVTLREVFARGVVNIDTVPLTDDPQFEVEVRLFPGVAVTSVWNSPFFPILDSTDPATPMTLPLSGQRHPATPCSNTSARRTLETTAPLCSSLAPIGASTENRTNCSSLTVRIQRSLLLPLLPDAEAALMHKVPPDNAALQLLTAYLEVLIANGAHARGPELTVAVAAHICDLVSLAVGTNRDAAALAAGRGLRAARLAAVKRWVLAHLGEPELSVVAAAGALNVSVRYVQMLFESEGTTFTDFVLAQRLAKAYRRLANPGLARRSIASIAFACGFGDLSYFNRSFRAAYGQSPSDVRRRALSDPS